MKYTFIVDLGQNMEKPRFGGNRPGDSYCFSPPRVYKLGVVNCALSMIQRITCIVMSIMRVLPQMRANIAACEKGKKEIIE